MKQKTLFSLAVIAVISGVISLIVSRYAFGSSTRQESAVVVPVITSSFPTPSTKYFNSQSIDPTQLIQIGTSSNNNPFSNSVQ